MDTLKNATPSRGEQEDESSYEFFCKVVDDLLLRCVRRGAFKTRDQLINWLVDLSTRHYHAMSLEMARWYFYASRRAAVIDFGTALGEKYE